MPGYQRAHLGFGLFLGLLVGRHAVHEIFVRRAMEEERRAMESDLRVRKTLLMRWWAVMHGVDVAMCLCTFYEAAGVRQTSRPAFDGVLGVDGFEMHLLPWRPSSSLSWSCTLVPASGDVFR